MRGVQAPRSQTQRCSHPGVSLPMVRNGHLVHLLISYLLLKQVVEKYLDKKKMDTRSKKFVNLTLQFLDCMVRHTK